MAADPTIYEWMGVAKTQTYFAGAIVSAGLLAGAGLLVRSKLRELEAQDEVRLEPKFSFLNAFIEIVDVFKNLARDLMGESGLKFLPIIVSTFLLILLGNVMGMFAGLNSPTADFNNNLAMGLVIFIMYHYFGFKEHGFAYTKQFTGGLPAPGFGVVLTIFMSLIAAFLVFLELISHGLRPITLTLRLWGVINGDHTLVDVVYGILPFPFTLFLPMIVLALGLIVSVVQALVFTLLSTVYFKLAISHDH